MEDNKKLDLEFDTGNFEVSFGLPEDGLTTITIKNCDLKKVGELLHNCLRINDIDCTIENIAPTK